MKANSIKNVHMFNCAVDAETGIAHFFAPEGHLTNGSLYREFAAIFSPSMEVRPVVTISGEWVADFARNCEKVLLKIDVEGAETRVLLSLKSFILTSKPDLVIEVLSIQQDELNKLDFLIQNYTLYSITDDGLVRQDHFGASDFRDYLLIANSDGHNE